MEFRQFSPSDILKPYIRHYYLFESDSYTEFEDIVFPSGDMEMIFNLGEGIWSSAVAGKFLPNPPIELWGQITKPLTIKSKGRHTMFGIRLYIHSAAYFFNDDIGQFNNLVSDLSDVLGDTVKALHLQLMETNSVAEKIALAERFLLKRLNEKKTIKINKVINILTSISTDNNINNIASKHGITSRYLHQLVYQYTGLSPKSVDKINRFKLSLKLIAKNDQPLTAIAYDCGYFDQSHFIRDFKSFTGFTPSAYLQHKSPVNQLLEI